jgi:BolA family transcriptional regulator, general stress-responsive regulator
MSVAEQLRSKLTAAFAPELLEITDESSKHAGHSGARPGGETHFHVRIVARAFEGLSRVKRHREVNTVLAEELRRSVHALSLSTLTPDEYAE